LPGDTLGTEPAELLVDEQRAEEHDTEPGESDPERDHEQHQHHEAGDERQHADADALGQEAEQGVAGDLLREARILLLEAPLDVLEDLLLVL
jgi:hypothetical protein